MKNNLVKFLCVLIMIFLAPVVLADSMFTILNSGMPIDSCGIDAAVSLSGGGRLYLIYLCNRTLCVKRSLDQGESFTSYPIRLGNRDLSGFRQLTLVSRLIQPVALFVADDRQESGVYAISIDAGGELCMSGIDDNSPGSVSMYAALPVIENSFLVTYLKSGILKCARFSVDSNIALKREGDFIISSGGNSVIDFRIKERLGSPGIPIFVGCFLEPNAQDSIALSAFTIAGSQLRGSTLLDTQLKEGYQELQCFSNMVGGTKVIWSNGQRISIFSTTAETWRCDINQVIPSGKFSFFPVTDGVHWLDAVIKDSSIYSLSGESGSGLSLIANSVSRIPGGIVSIQDSRFIMTYLIETAGTMEVHSKIYDFPSATWMDNEFPTVKNSRIFDAWAGESPSAQYIIELYEAADCRHLAVFRVVSSIDPYYLVADKPILNPIITSDQISVTVQFGGLFIVKVGRFSILVDVRTQEAGIIGEDVDFKSVDSAFNRIDPARYLMIMNGVTYLVTRSK